MRNLGLVCLAAAVGCGGARLSLTATRDGDTVRFVAHNAGPPSPDVSWRWAPASGAPGSACAGDTVCTLPYEIGVMTVYVKRSMSTDSMQITVR